SIKAHYEGNYKLNIPHKFRDESSQLFDIIKDKEYSHIFTFQACLHMREARRMLVLCLWTYRCE
ncbi:MAG: hypothetical protein OXC46_05455, partial [Thaumarchaeota archaeon]|nr:hypothetical protein [Nitrososphaerota archaeon]